MSIKRRRFIKMFPIRALLTAQMLNRFPFQGNPVPTFLISIDKWKNRDQLFKNRTLIDGLVISRVLYHRSFNNCDTSGYTGFDNYKIYR